jgi:HlyD family secretion protein
MKKRTKRVLIGLVVVAIAGGVGVSTTNGSAQPAPTGPTARATLTDLRSIANATGTVQATKQAALNFTNPGRVATVAVSAGDRVTAGAVLMTLDTTMLRLDVNAKEAAIAEAKAKLASVSAPVTPKDRAANAALVTQAKATRDQAATTLEQLTSVKEATLAELDKAIEVATLQNGRDTTQLEGEVRRLDEAKQTLVDEKKLRDEAKVKLDAARAAQQPGLTSKNQARDAASAAREELNRQSAAKDAAIATLDAATADYERLKALNTGTPDVPAGIVSDKDVVKARANVATATANLNRAQAEVTRLEGLYSAAGDSNGVTDRDAELAQGRYDATVGRVSSAQSNVDGLVQRVDAQRELARKSADQITVAEKAKTAGIERTNKELLAAKTQFASASDQVRLLETQNVQKEQGPRTVDVNAAESAIETARVALEQATLEVERATLRAPFAGTVVAVGAKPGEQVGSTTSALGTNAESRAVAAVTLLDDSALQLRLPLPEVDAARVKPGAEVTITFDSLGADVAPVAGTIDVVEPAPSVVNGVSTYVARISLQDLPLTVKLGMSASVEVLLGVRTNVLTVPADALSEKDGSTIVTVVTVDADKKTTTEVRSVVVGERSDGNVEIVRGLKAGELVSVVESNGANGANGAKK